jgi:HK97 family phage prohead protease
MTQILYRTAQLTPGDGRTVFGIAVPFGQVTEVSDGDGRPYKERFELGSCRRTIVERGHKLKLLVGHDMRRLPIGKATALEERDDGLHVEFAVSDTTAGNDTLTAIRDGLVGGFSVGFSGIGHRFENDVLVRTEVALNEISVTPFPAYSGAAIGGVRTSDLIIPRRRAEALLAILDWS